jgi:hypothetical protein
VLPADTAMHAIRLLGVDIANCMTRLAVYQATVEELIDLAGSVDTRSWEDLMGDDEVPTIVGVKLPLDQQQVLQRILILIDGLR